MSDHDRLVLVVGPAGAGKTTTVGAAAAALRQEGRLRATSRARDESYIRTHVLPVFVSAPIGRITQLDVRAWVAGLVAADLAPATVEKAYQTLSKILRAAVDANLIPHSPCRNIQLPKVERREMRFLTPAESLALSEVITPRYAALVLFDACCGLRLGERQGFDEAGSTSSISACGWRDHRGGPGATDSRSSEGGGP